MTVNITGKGEYILISNCTFDHVSPQIFDPKLEVIPQTKQSHCLYMPMLSIIFFLHPQRAPFVFVQFDRGAVTRQDPAGSDYMSQKDVLKSYLHHHKQSNTHA